MSEKCTGGVAHQSARSGPKHAETSMVTSVIAVAGEKPIKQLNATTTSNLHPSPIIAMDSAPMTPAIKKYGW